MTKRERIFSALLIAAGIVIFTLVFALVRYADSYVKPDSTVINSGSEASALDEIALADAADTESAPPSVIPAVKTSGDAETVTYVVNKSSGKFHLPDCPSVASMKEENKLYETDRDKIIAEGYKPCGSCNP